MIQRVTSSYSVYIRPLMVTDAAVSYQWRNNPKIWRLTGNRPDRYITQEIEEEWIRTVLKRPNEKRFAICLTDSKQYIGNVFLTDMQDQSAFFHIFLGDRAFWGGNRALQAAILLVTYAFEHLNIEKLFAEINKENRASIALAKLFGSEYVSEYFDEDKNMYLIKWAVTKELFYRKQRPKIKQHGNCIYSSY